VSGFVKKKDHPVVAGRWEFANPVAVTNLSLGEASFNPAIDFQNKTNKGIGRFYTEASTQASPFIARAISHCEGVLDQR
jgi:hypothetical protein